MFFLGSELYHLVWVSRLAKFGEYSNITLATRVLTMLPLTILESVTGGDFEEYSERSFFFFFFFTSWPTTWANLAHCLHSKKSRQQIGKRQRSLSRYSRERCNPLWKVHALRIPRQEGLWRVDHTAQRILQARSVFSNSNVSVNQRW